MQLREVGKTGAKVSPLGFGMMRLPMKDGGQAEALTPADKVDVEESIKMLRHAIDNGVNYVDTAFNYIGGMSEKITGMALEDGYREKVYLATKSPTWMYKSEDDFDSLLAKQLQRLKTDYIDFYMLHSINGGSWKRCLKYGAVEAIKKAKADGRVKHIGFSFHDDYDLFEEVLNAADWDFVQIQLNYYDANYQAGVKGLKLAAERGMGVIVMEPLRGGFLVDVPSKVQEAFDEAKNKRTPVEWSFDWLWNLPEVSTVLSGMGTLEEVDQNIASAQKAAVGMMDADDLAIIEKAKEAFSSYEVVPCTGCNYCVEYCPEKIAIPYNFNAYNLEFLKDLDAAKAYYQSEVTKFGKDASNCTSCGTCESICPQHIEISTIMPTIDEKLGA